MMAYLERKGRSVPVAGIPGCAMFAGRTVLDIILPLIITDIKIKKEDITAMGEGGLCLSCDICTYPNCGFGK